MYFALLVRLWVTLWRPYMRERERRGLKRFGRFGQFGLYFAEEDTSSPVSDEELERRNAQKRVAWRRHSLKRPKDGK